MTPERKVIAEFVAASKAIFEERKNNRGGYITPEALDKLLQAVESAEVLPAEC